MTQCRKKTIFRNDRGMLNAIFHDFLSDFLPKSANVVTMATSIEHDDLCINYLLSHQNTPHSKFEENLRPCVNSLHYRMLHDYRELILIYD